MAKRKQKAAPPIQDVGTPERLAKAAKHHLTGSQASMDAPGQIDATLLRIVRNAAGRALRAEVITAAHRMWTTGSAEMIACETYIELSAVAEGARRNDNASGLVSGGVPAWQRIPTSDARLDARRRLDQLCNRANVAVLEARDAGKKLPLVSVDASVVLNAVLVAGLNLRDAAMSLRIARDGFTELFRVMVEGMA